MANHKEVFRALIAVLFAASLSASAFFSFVFPSVRGGHMDAWVHELRIDSAMVALVTGFSGWRWIRDRWRQRNRDRAPDPGRRGSPRYR